MVSAVKCSAAKCAMRVARSEMCIYKAIIHTARCGHPVTIRYGQFPWWSGAGGWVTRAPAEKNKLGIQKQTVMILTDLHTLVIFGIHLQILPLDCLLNGLLKNLKNVIEICILVKFW